jgi:hypothetical protein
MNERVAILARAPATVPTSLRTSGPPPSGSTTRPAPT